MSAPKLTRIRFATLAARDVRALATQYCDDLGYRITAEGTVSPGLAASWGAPKTAGRAFINVASPASPETCVRMIECDIPDDFPEKARGLSYGWNAIEIIVDDLDAVHARMQDARFEILAPPWPITPTLQAMQVQGPAGDVLYLTTETGNRATSTVPEPKCMIDRPFVLVLAGPDLLALRDAYARLFALAPIPVMHMPITILAQALGLPADHAFPLTILRGAERGNTIEFDGFPQGLPPRPRVPGHLPAGLAMASFIVPSLDDIPATFIAPPQALYDGRRAATFVGPVGELVELIEG